MKSFYYNLEVQQIRSFFLASFGGDDIGTMPFFDYGSPYPHEFNLPTTQIFCLLCNNPFPLR